MGAANSAGPPSRRVTVNRHIHLICDGVSSHRVRAHGRGRAGVRSFAFSVDNSEDRSGTAPHRRQVIATAEEIMVVAGIEPDFVGAGFARKRTDDRTTV